MSIHFATQQIECVKTSLSQSSPKHALIFIGVLQRLLSATELPPSTIIIINFNFWLFDTIYESVHLGACNTICHRGQADIGVPNKRTELERWMAANTHVCSDLDFHAENSAHVISETKWKIQ